MQMTVKLLLTHSIYNNEILIIKEKLLHFFLSFSLSFLYHFPPSPFTFLGEKRSQKCSKLTC